MVIIKEANPKDLFSKRLAILTVDTIYISLVFDEPFTDGRNKFKQDDSISKEYFSHRELDSMKHEFKINKLPFEIYDEYKLQDVYDFVRK
jgi:hypothetical protein